MADMMLRAKIHNFGVTLRALWRWLVSYDSRERLSFAVEEIVRDSRLDAERFSAALDDFAKYMEMIYVDRRHEASEFYAQILTTYPTRVRSLAKCAILLRHGLFKGRLAAHDYDLVQTLCQRIQGGDKLRPFLSRINRANRRAT